MIDSLLTTQVLILAGAIIMAFSIAKFSAFPKMLQKISVNRHLRLHWFFRCHLILMIGFLIGYLLVLFAISNAIDVVGDMFVGIIFFFGAIFVLLGITLQGKMFAAIDANYQKSLSLNKTLEFEADQLKISNQQLNQEIAARQQAEQKLAKAERYIRNIINSMPSVLIGVDPQGLVSYWNSGAESKLGIAAATAEGKPLGEIFPELEQFLPKIDTTIDSGAQVNEEKLTLDRGDGRRFCELAIYPLAVDRNEGVVIRLDDVTDKVILAEQLIQTEKMLSLGELAAGIAHEINNPLAGILQNLQLLNQRLTVELPKDRAAAAEYGLSPEGMRSYLEQRGLFQFIESALETGRRAAKIVENMLSFSRKSEAELVSRDLGELLDLALELADKDFNLHHNFDFREIEIFRVFETGLPPICCEPGEILQVLLNLLRNARHSLAENRDQGKPARLWIRLAREDDMLRLEIEDNGPGMTEEVRRRVFEPFFTTKAPGMGTGLGLSVSRNIITRKHGGKMMLESAPGQGCKFVILLPRIDTDQSS